VPRSAAALPALALAALALVAGCTSGGTPPPAPSAPTPTPALRLDASVTQFRSDEGTRRLKAGVTNQGSGDVRVTRATIEWAPLAFPTLDLPGEVVHPGQTAAFAITYGRPDCVAPTRTAPVLVAEVDGTERRLPLRVEDPALLRRLQAKACAAERLHRSASVRFRLGTRTVRVAGEEYLPGRLVLSRRAGATPVRVVDLEGSVLITLVPRDGRPALPATLGRQSRVVLPLLFGSAHRCDAHALGQSTQTFLLSAYLRLGSGPTQRLVLPLTAAERDRLFGVVHRDCS
jgi:hypothetical protein